MWFVEVPLQFTLGLNYFALQFMKCSWEHSKGLPHLKILLCPTCSVGAPLQSQGDSQPDAQAHCGGDQDQDDCQGGPGVGGDGVDRRGRAGRGPRPLPAAQGWALRAARAFQAAATVPLACSLHRCGRRWQLGWRKAMAR